ncbi:hypothetical protein Bca101_082678 [Brassica carinata]
MVEKRWSIRLTRRRKVTRDDVATSHLPGKSDVAMQVADSHWPRGDLAPKFASFHKVSLGLQGRKTW